MADVKIIYCYDTDKNVVYYNDTAKSVNYYCIDCGEELIVKDGNLKVKHLSHKTNSNCASTGESIFHKHWKTNLFKAGLFISVGGKDYEILKVQNEIPLSKYYNKIWNREIIVDTLLTTTGGDIVIEIFYTNNKDWLSLEQYYDDLKDDLIAVFEVGVSKCVTDNISWMRHKDIIKVEKKKIADKIETDKKNELKNSVKTCLAYAKPSDTPYYDSDEDLTFVKTTIWEPAFQTSSNKEIKIKGNVMANLRHKYLTDKSLFNLRNEIFTGKISYKNGYLHGNTFEYKDTIKKYGGRYDNKTWDIKGTDIEDIIKVFCIEFNYTGGTLKSRNIELENFAISSVQFDYGLKKSLKWERKSF